MQFSQTSRLADGWLGALDGSQLNATPGEAAFNSSTLKG